MPVTVILRAASGATETRVLPDPVVTTPATLPAPWVYADVGAPSLAGSASFASGVFTVKGAGIDLWTPQDQFGMVYQTLTGDATITARVTAQQNTHAGAKSGIIVKQSLTAQSPYALIAVSPAQGINVQTAFNQSFPAINPSAPPNSWLRLTRIGNTVTGYTSANGQAWTQVAAVNVNFTGSVVIGLFVNSHDANVLNTSTFDNVSVSPVVVVPPPPPSGATFPRLAGILIGSPKDYGNTTYRNQIAKLDVAILGMYRGWNVSGFTPSQAVNAIKAINPNILLGNYTLMTENYSDRNVVPMQDIWNKLSSEKGPSGIGNWWAYDSAGNHTDWSGGSYGTWDTNLTLLTTPDSNGDRYPQWLAKRDNTNLISNANFDIWFSDNNMWKPRDDPDWNRNGSNDSQNDSTVQNNWRNGQRAYYDTAKTVQPSKLLVVNADNDLDGSVFKGITTYTQFTGVLHGALLERCIGESWSAETWGGWSVVMGWYHRIYTNLLSPKMVIFGCHMGVNPADYKQLRYAFGACLMNNAYFSVNVDNYTAVKWYDEFDLAGTSTTKWLGKAVDPPQTASWSQGVYRRVFEHGMVLVNPKGNGSRTVTVGPGYHRFSGSQASSVNNGAAVTSTVTLADRDGLFLVAN